MSTVPESTQKLRALPAMLKSLPAEEQQLLLETGHLARYAKGQELQKEGQYPSHTLIVLSGYFTIQIMGRAIRVRGPNTWLANTLGERTPSAATFKTISPVLAVALDRGVLREIVMRHPKLAIQSRDALVQVLHNYHLYLYRLCDYAVDTRLAAVLWDIGELQPDGTKKLPTAVTQSILASILRVTREDVNKKRKSLIAARILLRQGNDWYMSAMTPALFNNVE